MFVDLFTQQHAVDDAIKRFVWFIVGLKCGAISMIGFIALFEEGRRRFVMGIWVLFVTNYNL